MKVFKFKGKEWNITPNEKGGYTLTEKKAAGGGGLHLLLLIAVLAAVILFFFASIIFAITAFFVDEKLSDKLKYYSKIHFYFLAGIFAIFLTVDNRMGEVFLQDKILFLGLIGINLIGFMSAWFGNKSAQEPSRNKPITIITSIIYIISFLFFGRDYVFNNKGIDFTHNQLSKACECYENSRIHMDRQSSDEKSIAHKCVDLFHNISKRRNMGFREVIIEAMFLSKQGKRRIIRLKSSTIIIGKLEVMTEDLLEDKYSLDEAKTACATLGDGWRFPTQDELNILYENKDNIGGFADDCYGTCTYWSSTEYDIDYFEWKNNEHGFQSGTFSPQCYIRAVRSK